MTVLVVAALVAAVCTGLAIPLLRLAGVVDIPNGRSSHQTSVPRGGGVGVLVGLAGAVAVVGVRPQEALMIIGAALIAVALGFLDDVRTLPVLPRLAAQAALGLLVAGWLTSQHVGQVGLVLLGAVAGAIWLVAYVNAFNFMDGINGISGLSAVVAGGWYAWLGHHYDQPAIAVLGLALAGASAGFLPWNLPKARVFLGDAGSYGIGMVVGCTGLAAVLDGIPLWVAAAPLAIYLTDTAWTLAKRVSRGDSWREAHREHVYQRLVDVGWSHLEGAVLVATAALLLALASAVLPVGWFVMCAVIFVLGYLGLPAVIGPKRVASTLNIAFVTQWFDAEGGSAAIPGAMVRALEERGNRMEVVTGYPNHPIGDLLEGYRVHLPSSERHGATKIHRVPLYPIHDRSAVLRAVNFISFMISSATIGAFLARRSQVALIYATPVTAGLAGVVLRRLFGRPFVIYVQDLWPDTVVDTGMRPTRLDGMIGAALEPFCRLVYRSASRVAVISPGMKRLLVARGVADSKIDVIYSWVDDELFHPEPRGAPSECFRLMYAGDLGDVQGLETLVKAVATLGDLSDLEVVLVGAGVAEQPLRAMVTSLGLQRRVLFKESRPTCEMSLVMAQAHVQLVSLKDLPLFHATMPSEVQAILACGLPMIISAPGDAAELVLSAGAGIYATPSNVAELANAIRTAHAMKGAALDAMGLAGRGFYERELAAGVGAEKLEASLMRAYADSIAS